MSKNLLLIIALLAVTACTSKTVDLKSPCVGGDNSPCVRRAVNMDRA